MPYAQPTKIYELDPQARQERLDYLRFRMRVVVNVSIFMIIMKKNIDKNFDARCLAQHRSAVAESSQGSDLQPKTPVTKVVKEIYFCLLSLCFWFTLYTTPAIMIFPELNDTLFTLLWVNEAAWAVEILRKAQFNAAEGEEPMEAALRYMKSTLIFDLTATLPQMASLMNQKFAFLKIIRLYQLWLLHYPVEVAVNIRLRKWDKIHIYAIVYAVATTCRILVLLHYLGCIWIYIGSSSFENYEVDHVPWILANDDLKEMSVPQLFVFSTYWVCTVITTLGYGDYTGGTSLEYLFTLAVELFGFIIFATLQIAVL